jgi:hypothetical protein
LAIENGIVGVHVELVLFLFAIGILWVFSRRSRGAVDKPSISTELAQRQLDYMRLMNTSPRLKGNGDFSLSIIAEPRYQDDLNTIHEMLEQQYTTDSSFMAVLSVAKPSDSKAPSVRVSVGDETVGFLPPGVVGQVASDLTSLGGVALVEARLADPSRKLATGLRLDMAIPIAIST